MKTNLFLLALLTVLLSSGCGLFKEKCDCPKFNYQPTDDPFEDNCA